MNRFIICLMLLLGATGLSAQNTDLHFIEAADLNHDTTSDGTHPSDWGYHIWAESVRKPILKILKKYGIK